MQEEGSDIFFYQPFLVEVVELLFVFFITFNCTYQCQSESIYLTDTILILIVERLVWDCTVNAVKYTPCVRAVQKLLCRSKRTNLCIKGDFFYHLGENYTDRMTPYGILFTHNVFPLQAL